MDIIPSIPVPAGTHFICRGREGILTAMLDGYMAVCLHDPVTETAAMGVITIPDDAEAMDEDATLAALKQLLHDFTGAGVLLECSIVQVFGGALRGRQPTVNTVCCVTLVRQFCRDRALPVLASSLGGVSRRIIQYYPHNGRVLQRFMAPAADFLSSANRN